jgi:hypothetical protein
MTNDPCIIFVVEWNWLLVDIQRVSDNTCSPPDEYPYEPWHLSEFVCNFRIGSPTLPGAPKVLSGAPTCSQTYHNHSPGTPVTVIRDPSYSEGRPECPSRVWYSPEIDTSKFTLHILSDTPGVFLSLKYILLMSVLDSLLVQWPHAIVQTDIYSIAHNSILLDLDSITKQPCNIVQIDIDSIVP